MQAKGKGKDGLDPTSLVARIIAELQANPDAQRLLLRALLTNEFLGMPARLDRVEKDIAELKIDVRQLKIDVRQLKVDVRQLKVDVGQLKVDVAQLKGSDLENRLHRKIGALLSQTLKLRRAQVMHSPARPWEKGFADQVEDAVDAGRITDEQEARLAATDLIVHAQRRADRKPVWLALEASHTVRKGDIERVQASAEALRAVFGVEALAVAAGYGIDPPDAQRAEAAGVRYLQVAPPHPA